jgi:pyruvate/2-oxoglutarate dehydrogenase complex dihydrolipoamide dehydrogenase (E3) component
LIPENELSKSGGVTLSPVTNGQVVNDALETNVEGIFACGNVLHVHDLVDLVSQEAANAGEYAAEYIRNGKTAAGRVLPIRAVDGVRYTVPSMVRVEQMQDTVTVRLRVGDVYQDCAIVTYAGDKEIGRRKKKVFAPGEMEQVILRKADLMDADISELTIRIEKEG